MMQVREKMENSFCFSRDFCGSAGSTSRLAKAAGAEPAPQISNEQLHAVVARSTIWKSKVSKTDSFGALLEVEMLKKCTLSWCEADLEVENVKTPQLRTTFGSCDVGKVYVVMARSTCGS